MIDWNILFVPISKPVYRRILLLSQMYHKLISPQHECCLCHIILVIFHANAVMDDFIFNCFFISIVTIFLLTNHTSRLQLLQKLYVIKITKLYSASTSSVSLLINSLSNTCSGVYRLYQRHLHDNCQPFPDSEICVS